MSNKDIEMEDNKMEDESCNVGLYEGYMVYQNEILNLSFYTHKTFNECRLLYTVFFCLEGYLIVWKGRVNSK